MRVSALELPAVFDDVAGQLERVDRALSNKSDLVLLPEASLTGYVSVEGDYDLTRFAEDAEGETASALRALARKHRVHLVGPLVERDGERVYNTMLGFDPEGRRFLRYRKRHPWDPETWATEGALPYPTFAIGARLFTLAICFDVHFLDVEAARELVLADVLLFPSAWVEEPDTRATMLCALARKYDVAIVNANWGVGAPRIAGQGGSMIVSREGEIVARVVDGRVDHDDPAAIRGKSRSS